MPGQLSYYAHGQAVILVCTGIHILHEQVAPLQISHQAGVQLLEFLARHRPVVLSPPDMSFGAHFTDDELVIRRARGMFPCKSNERPAMDGRALGAKNSFFVQGFTGQVPVSQAQVGQAMVREAVIRFAGLSRAFRGGFDV